MNLIKEHSSSLNINFINIIPNKFLEILFVLILIVPILNIKAQTFYISGSFLYNLQFNNNICECEYSTIGFINLTGEGSTFSPDGNLYTLGDLTINEVDLGTGILTPIFTGPLTLPDM